MEEGMKNEYRSKKREKEEENRVFRGGEVGNDDSNDSRKSCLKDTVREEKFRIQTIQETREA